MSVVLYYVINIFASTASGLLCLVGRSQPVGACPTMRVHSVTNGAPAPEIHSFGTGRNMTDFSDD